MKNKSNVTMRKIYPNVFLDTYDFQYDLCMSFVRIQEFYESPKFKGKYFTLEEFIDWWSLEQSKHKGSFDYPSRWIGFNVPGEIILDWLLAVHDGGGDEPLRPKEIMLLNRLAKKFKEIDTKYAWSAKHFYQLFKGKIEGSYLIGCHKEDGNAKKRKTVEHELAHAMYTLNPKYKKSCIKLLTKMGHDEDDKLIRECATSDIIKMGYDKSVVEDEMQAYFSTGDRFGIRQEFVNNFKKFKNNTCAN